MSTEFESAKRLESLKQGIEAKTGETYDDLTGGVNALIAGYGSGDDSYYDTFWDAYQKGGLRTDYSSAFMGECWTDDAFKPKYNIKPTSCANAFQNCAVSNIKNALESNSVTLDTSGAGAFLNTFQGAKTKELPIIDCSKASQFGNMFNSAAYIESIELVNVKATVSNWNNTFRMCYALKSIKTLNFSAGGFNAQTFQLCSALETLEIVGVIAHNNLVLSGSPLLTRESLLNILDVLADKTADTSGTVWKITLGSDNIAKLTEEELQIAYRKGWSVV